MMTWDDLTEQDKYAMIADIACAYLAGKLGDRFAEFTDGAMPAVHLDEPSATVFVTFPNGSEASFPFPAITAVVALRLRAEDERRARRN